jgi:aminopeptidase N
VLAATSPDAVLLEGWLVDRVTHTGIDVDPRLRWVALRRLATLGALTAAEIEEERLADGTVVGELGAAAALASRPDEAAKAEAWERMFLDPDVSNRMFEALSAGFWQPEQVALVHPYVDRYLAAAPTVSAERGQAFSQLVGRAFPAIPLTPRDVAGLEAALEGDLPTVLRRHWDDRLDDLRRIVASGSSRA